MSMFQERLRLLKDESGKTQATIASELGLTQQNFSYYINGREPDYDVLTNIANYFDVSIDYLLGTSECKKVENQSLQAVLGLSERTIEKIKKYNHSKNVTNGVKSSDVLDDLISSPFFEDVLRRINMYLEMAPNDWDEEAAAIKKSLIRPNLLSIATTPLALKHFVKEQIVNSFGTVIESLPTFDGDGSRAYRKEPAEADSTGRQ